MYIILNSKHQGWVGFENVEREIVIEWLTKIALDEKQRLNGGLSDRCHTFIDVIFFKK